MADSTPLKVWIHGANGRMGQHVQECITELKEFRLSGGSGKDYLDSGLHKDTTLSVENLGKELRNADYIIDFSSVDGNQVLLNAVTQQQTKTFCILIATTGLPEHQVAKWRALLGHTVLFARNTSLGISLTLQACLATFAVVKNLGFDVEIHEAHHRFKADAPSGTALLLADGMTRKHPEYKSALNAGGNRKDKTIGLSYTRGGQVFGEHTVSFLGDDEEIRISHRALSRKLFAKGALILCKWLQTAKPGIYFVEDLSPAEFNDLSIH